MRLFLSKRFQLYSMKFFPIFYLLWGSITRDAESEFPFDSDSSLTIFGPNYGALLFSTLYSWLQRSIFSTSTPLPNDYMHKFLFHFLNKTTDYKKYVNLNYMPETESKVFKFPAQTPDSLLWSQHFFDSDTFFIRLRLQVFNFSYFSQLRHCISIT